MKETELETLKRKLNKKKEESFGISYWKLNFLLDYPFKKKRA